MAIQIPNLGNGDGLTGENELVIRQKYNNNFSDPTHAASKLLGMTTGRVPLAEDIYQTFTQQGVSNTQATDGLTNMSDFPAGVKVAAINGGSYPDKPQKPQGGGDSWCYRTEAFGAGYNKYQFAYPYRDSDIYFRGALFTSGNYGEWGKIYTSANTTKDSNGFIKASSPIVKVFADKVELNGEAVDQNVTYKKNGVGDYTITTVSGLSTDGWYIELPKDMNGNPKVAVTLSEVEGVISLKSYKRIFSMETFTFEPDLDNPLDIPVTRWIDLRLNEIPFEAQEELPTEGG